MLSRTAELAHGDGPQVVTLDCGGCHGCALETVTWLAALSDAGRLRLLCPESPELADVVVVTGVVLRQQIAILRRLHQRMTRAPLVMAVGACGLSGGVFSDAYGVIGGVGEVIPVDVAVPGCPPRAGAVFDGLFRCLSAITAEQRVRISA